MTFNFSEAMGSKIRSKEINISVAFNEEPKEGLKCGACGWDYFEYTKKYSNDAKDVIKKIKCTNKKCGLSFEVCKGGWNYLERKISIGAER